jgi:deoxyribodipyrimidine photo-lyase
MGEAYFAEKLLDFDLAAIMGDGNGPQEVVAMPHPISGFLILLQTKKFDPDLQYIRKWVPDLKNSHIRDPLLNHEFARRDVWKFMVKR